MKDIKSIHHIPYFDSMDRIESIQPLEECSIQTAIGDLTPIYSVEDHGEKSSHPLNSTRMEM